MNTKLKICIAVPCYDSIKPKTLKSLSRLLINSPYDISLIVQLGTFVNENRVKIAVEAMGNNCDYLLFVDSDMVFDGDVLDRLIARDKDIIGVNYNCRFLPLETTVRFKEGDKFVFPEVPKDLFKCDAVGTGLMLVKIPVFFRVPQPWFKLEFTDYGSLKVGEDIWFCEQAQRVGYEVWCDGTIKVGHLGEYIY